MPGSSSLNALSAETDIKQRPTFMNRVVKTLFRNMVAGLLGFDGARRSDTAKTIMQARYSVDKYK
jgi:hypothetical protein